MFDLGCTTAITSSNMFVYGAKRLADGTGTPGRPHKVGWSAGARLFYRDVLRGACPVPIRIVSPSSLEDAQLTSVPPRNRRYTLLIFLRFYQFCRRFDVAAAARHDVGQNPRGSRQGGSLKRWPRDHEGRRGVTSPQRTGGEMKKLIGSILALGCILCVSVGSRPAQAQTQEMVVGVNAAIASISVEQQNAILAQLHAAGIHYIRSGILPDDKGVDFARRAQAQGIRIDW